MVTQGPSSVPVMALGHTETPKDGCQVQTQESRALRCNYPDASAVGVDARTDFSLAELGSILVGRSRESQTGFRISWCSCHAWVTGPRVSHSVGLEQRLSLHHWQVSRRC